MTRRRLLVPSVLLVSAFTLAPRAPTLTAAQGPSAATAEAPEYGPPNGTLFIHGGGALSLAGVNKFIELGGGVDGTFVIVPTANGNFDLFGNDRRPHVYVESQVVGFWKSRGLKNVRMLHTHDPKIANTVEFAQILSDATAVWFSGGRHHRIVDSYAGTLTYTEFHKVLERGGVIGGSSAGATIQGEYLVRGDSNGAHIMMTEEPNHQKGFEFLRRTAIDQHIDARNRWNDLVPVIRRFPHLLGIGLSEDTAIVVRGDQFEVMGKAQVAIHDNTRKYPQGEKPYFLLEAGDVYNMKTRQVVTGAGASHRPATSEPTESARARASAPPDDLPRSAAASGAIVATGKGRGAIPAPIPITLPRLLERLLMILGDDESWSQMEVIDVNGDGDIDLLRIHLMNGATLVWQMAR